MTEGLLTPEQILLLVLDPEKCKAMFSERVLKHVESFVCGNFAVWDVKLQVKGYEEEKFFAGNSLIRLNLRRGNSLILVYNRKEEGEVKLENIECVEWVRRGIIKFFDLCLEQINKVLGKTGRKVGKKVKKSKKKGASKEQVHFLTFDKIESSLESGKSIEIYLTEKANGENVQVSYIGLLHKWIISSKNCSMALSDLQDLSYYTTDRYKFVHLIAKFFFSSIFPNIPDIDALKKYLQGKTMVGEYIGNKDFQHVVKYSSEAIKFYAIVENSSYLPCIPVPEAFNIFEKFHIPSVKVQRIGSFVNKIEMFKSLKKVFKSISIENIDQGGEGAVLYFVENEEINIEADKFIRTQEFDSEALEQINKIRRTLALVKVKTLEYRILRKIREKIKGLSEGKLENSIKVFEDECKELLGEFGMNDKVDGFVQHFKSVAEVKLRKKGKKGGNLNELIGVSRPIVFLETSWASYIDKHTIQEQLGLDYESNKSITKYLEGHLYHNLISKNNIPLLPNAYYFITGFDEISEQNFFNYIHSCKKFEDLPKELQTSTKKKDLPKLKKKIHDYYKAKRKMYKDISFQKSAKLFYIKAENDLNILKFIKNELLLNQRNIFTQSKSRPGSIVFFSVSIPGSGKTFMNNYFSTVFNDQLLYEYKYIDYSKLLIENTNNTENIKQNININEICTDYKTLFIQGLKEEISNWVENNQRTLVVYVENNFSYEEFNFIIKNLKEAGDRVKTVAVLPKSSEFHLTKNLSFSVSPIFLVVCLKRKMDAKIQNNFNLNEILNEMTRVYERFIELNVKCFKSIKDEFDECFEFPMVNEDQVFEESDFMTLLRNTLQTKKKLEESMSLIYEVLKGYIIEERDLKNEFKANMENFMTRLK